MPASLISWNRLLAGRFQDPLAGGHLLVGVTLGAGTSCVVNSLFAMPFVATFAPVVPWSGASPLISLWFSDLILAIGGGFIYLFLLSPILKAVRLQWLAASPFVLLVAVILAPGYGGALAAIGRPAVILLAVVIALTRFGLLAATAVVFTRTSLADFPLTTNWSAWYAGWAVVGLATVLALALYGFVTTIKGRTLGSAKPRHVIPAPL